MNVSVNRGGREDAAAAPHTKSLVSVPLPTALSWSVSNNCAPALSQQQL